MGTLGPIKSWSFSRWDVTRRCPKRAELAFVHKIPEPAQPNSPATRGDAAHKSIELVTRGKAKVDTLHPAANPFRAEVIHLSKLMKRGNGEAERMWCFDRDWLEVDEKDFNATWLRVKLDQLVWKSSTSAVLVDYKTGKRDGNEVKHAEQMQLYAIAAFMRFPELEELWVELWYLDQDVLIKKHYRRDQALRYLPIWTERGIDVTERREFKANPSTWNCSYCPFRVGYMGKSGVKGTGHCKLAP